MSMSLRRLAPILLLLAVAVLVFATGLHRYLSIEALATHRRTLSDLVANQPVLAPVAYVGAYALAVALSLPGGLVLTLAGGLLFGHWQGGALAVAGATVGAVGVFLAARGAFAAPLARRAGPLLDKIRPGLERDGLSYLLVLRLVPLFPFWLVNLAPALVGMRLGPYALGTFLGIIPATFVFAGIGAGLGQVLDQGGTPELSILLRPGVLLPLLGLALLSLLPVAWRRYRTSAA